MNRPSLTAFVHLGYGFGAARCQILYQRGLAPDRVPYGFHHAEELGASVLYSVDYPESAAVRKARKSLQRLLGFDLVHAFRNRKAIAAADIVWTMEEKQHLAVLVWSHILPSLRNKKVIGQTIWLYDRWKKMSRLKRTLLSYLLKRAAVLTVHSRNYVDMPELSASSLHTHFLPFGISRTTFPINNCIRMSHAPVRVLSMGNDPTRDWDTLLTAFGNDHRFELIVITEALTPAMLSTYSNVSKREQPSMATFRNCYQWADFVVIPMIDNLYSGITVALEAASMGVPIVSSATGGVPTYFDANEVLYVKPNDAEALRKAVLNCTEKRREELVQHAQRRFLKEDYSTRGMARRYVELSHKILNAGSAPNRAENITGLDSCPVPLSHQASRESSATTA